MFQFTVILIVALLRSFEAIIVDSYYMPSAPKEQVDQFVQSRPNKFAVSAREKQNELDYEYSTHKPVYKYGYSVFDPYTLDVKSQWEHREGDVVRGAYNMLEADGSLRIVEYTSDKDSGFRAIVKKIPFYMEKSQKPIETLSQLTKNQESVSPLNQQPNLNNNNYQPIHYQQPNSYQPAVNYQLPANNHQSNDVSANYNQKQLYHQTENQISGNYYKKQYQKKQKKSSSPVAGTYRKLLPIIA